MPRLSLLGKIFWGTLFSVAFVALLWWRYLVDEKVGYCQTPRETGINRQGIPVGEPCQCHGMGGGVFGLNFDRNSHS